MTTTTILLIIVCAWLAIMLPLAVLIGRALRHADERRNRPPSAPDDARDIDGLSDDD